MGNIRSVNPTKTEHKKVYEAELVGVNDVIPQVLWTTCFLEAQGYGVDGSIVYQDNQSSIALQKYGQASSSKHTRHINIRYFFVTNQIASNEVSIEYCPTHEILADFLQNRYKEPYSQSSENFIMNCDPVTNSLQDHRCVLRNGKGPNRPDGKRTDGANITWADVVAKTGEPMTKDKSLENKNAWTEVKQRRKVDK
jgi:hypothetical protein